MYENEAGASNGIESLITWARSKEAAQVKPAKEAGKFHFNVVAKNNKVRSTPLPAVKFASY
jgi:hypothetical protein